MKLLRQTALLLAFLFAGEALKAWLHLSFPGTVLAMVLLLLALSLKLVKTDQLEELSRFLLDHLAFFFLPAGVGLIAYFNILKSSGPILLMICIVTTVLIMAFTGLCVQFLIQLVEKQNGPQKEAPPHA